jgi:hypothetical protein
MLKEPVVPGFEEQASEDSKQQQQDFEKGKWNHMHCIHTLFIYLSVVLIGYPPIKDDA